MHTLFQKLSFSLRVKNQSFFLGRLILAVIKTVPYGIERNQETQQKSRNRPMFKIQQ